MYEDYALKVEAMGAAKDMVREAIRQQYSCSERKKMPWEE